MTSDLQSAPLLAQLHPKVAAFCETHGIAKLEVFGSFASGTAGPSSDLDLLVTLKPSEHHGWDFFTLYEELEEITGLKVDLLSRRSVERDENGIRRNSILQSAREIYAV